MCNWCAEAHTYMVEFSFGNLKLNETRYFSVSFKPSLKCGIAENVNFRKCRSRVRERTSTSASFLQENSILNETRYFSVSFKPSLEFNGRTKYQFWRLLN